MNACEQMGRFTFHFKLGLRTRSQYQQHHMIKDIWLHENVITTLDRYSAPLWDLTTLVESFDTCLDHSGSILAETKSNPREFQKHEQKLKISIILSPSCSLLFMFHLQISPQKHRPGLPSPRHAAARGVAPAMRVAPVENEHGKHAAATDGV